MAGDARAAELLRDLDSRRDPAPKSATDAPSSGASKALSRLSNREMQVLRLIGKGHSNKVIARELFLSENTIETHLRRIYEKLGTHNRTETAALAREEGQYSDGISRYRTKYPDPKAQKGNLTRAPFLITTGDSPR